MSSTGRGGERAEADFYPTPAYSIDRLLDAFRDPIGQRRWLELGAGDGAIIRAVNAWHDRQGLVHPEWTAIELRRECEVGLRALGAEVVIDAVQRWAASRAQAEALGYEQSPIAPLFDVAAFNPPFSEALTFVKLALRLARFVICLERSPWIGDAAERHAFFQDLMPDEYRVGRIDFDGRGGDSIPYSWFVWSPGCRARRRGRLQLLDLTPSTERVRAQLPPRRQQGLFG